MVTIYLQRECFLLILTNECFEGKKGTRVLARAKVSPELRSFALTFDMLIPHNFTMVSEVQFANYFESYGCICFAYSCMMYEGVYKMMYVFFSLTRGLGFKHWECNYLKTYKGVICSS